MATYTVPFTDISLRDIPTVGGKLASIGEMINALSAKGINTPDGFAITTDAYRSFLKYNQLEQRLHTQLEILDIKTLSNLQQVGSNCRKILQEAVFPNQLQQQILTAYHDLSINLNSPVAVRSSATAEDLPTASFAGQHDSFLNICGDGPLLEAVHRCYISLYNDRAIKYRLDNGFDHLSVFLSVGVQQMVRSDKACAGVVFTIDPENGNENILYLTGLWGLGEMIVQGAANPDEFYFFKPSLAADRQSLVYRKLGSKENMMIFNAPGMDTPVKVIETDDDLRAKFVLSDEEATQLAKWCYDIELHYGQPMDIEWAKDGETGAIFILQARPETVHSTKQVHSIKEYALKERTEPLCSGKAVGKAIVSGRVCILESLKDSAKVQKGDIIVADITNPDWNTLLRRAVSIVTNKGGRTSHAAIVARELGISAVVGTSTATEKLRDGQEITVSCAEGDIGYIYDGKIAWEVRERQIDNLTKTRTKAMFILGDSDKALALSRYPNDGIGLLRIEFAITARIKVHPMALIEFDKLPNGEEKERVASICHFRHDKREFFIEQLSECIALSAAAFYPKDVIVRLSDFKTNEYAQLIGGRYFEPKEENPMIGFRGASRYYHPRYKEAFKLECEALKEVRDNIGLTNVKIMVPFCRTVSEGVKVLRVMEDYGLKRGDNGLEIYLMAEIPSNIILADEFAKWFDGFSIGSNDLTQLTLGLDRDSAITAHLFDENDRAVKIMIKQAIEAAKRNGCKIGLCGQAPSDFPDYTRFLVELGIDSISFNEDALLNGIENIILAERQLKVKQA